MDQAILERIKTNMFPEEAEQATPQEDVISEGDPQSPLVDAQEDYEEPEEAVSEAEESSENVELEAETEDLEQGTQEPERWTLEEVAESLEMDVDDLLNDWEIDLDGQKVPLAELKKGTLRESDYTKKTMALSEERKAFEATSKQKLDEYEQNIAMAGQLAHAAEQLLISDYNQADMNRLKEEDREEWLIKDAEFRQRAAQVQQLKQTAIQQYQEFKAKESAVSAEKAPEEIVKLRDAIPEFKDDAKFESNMRDISRYFTGLGYTGDELANMYDHRSYVLAYKAMKYDELQSKKPEMKKKAKSVPKVLKPKGRKSTEPVEVKRKKELRQRLKKSGNVNDFAALIKDNILAGG
jgi:hypothetical protein